MMRYVLLILFAVFPVVMNAREDPAARSAVEQHFKKDGKLLIRMSGTVKDGTAGTSIRFSSETLKTHQLYAASGDHDYLYIRQDGFCEGIPDAAGKVNSSGEILITPSGTTLFADGQVLKEGFKDWTFFWVASEKKAPSLQISTLQQIDFEDSYMRSVLENDCCTPEKGVFLNKHGGGLAETREQLRDPSFQRAVNPFTVIMKNGAELKYSVVDDNGYADFRTGASFYFGKPVLDLYVDRNSLPMGDLLVYIGPKDGPQVSFGWNAEKQVFQLRSMDTTGVWQVLGTYSEKRPPVTNWVCIALEVRNGYELTGLLDGKEVLKNDVRFRVTGPVRLSGSTGIAECDDFFIVSLPVKESPGEPLLARNDQFAGKDNKGGSDPKEFREWAESAAVFRMERWAVHDDEKYTAILTDLPIMGDFTYEAVPFSDKTGRIPDGEYEFRLLKAVIGTTACVRETAPVFTLKAVRKENAWTVSDPVSGSERSVEVLRFGRRAQDDSRIMLYTGNEWTPVSGPVTGSVRFAVLLHKKGRGLLFSPSPNHHMIFCRNLENEFFIKAPVRWNWVDGAFRMSSRWACQNNWDFMSCASYALPFMTGKTYFGGNQTHEYYMSLRSILPWDIGDREFKFDREADRKNKWAIYHAHNRWYNLRSLAFSFCTDGLNPLSGYSIVLGAEGDTETQLLRKGVVVSRVTEYKYLIPSQDDFRHLHWHWFRFSVEKEGARVQVRFKGDLIFDYTDPEPIEGGFAGFWTLRNGFIVTRLSSMADEIREDPLRYYVQNDIQSGWKPFFTDAVVLSNGSSEGMTRVTNHFGGGFFAVRYTFPEPVKLIDKPVLNLPIRFSEHAHADIHLFTSKGSYVITTDGNSPKKMRSLLTPEYEKGETFQVTYLDLRNRSVTASPGPDNAVRVDLKKELPALFDGEPSPVLNMVTVGNTSEFNDMVTGFRNNRAGDWYEVGVPGLTDE